MAAPSPPVWKGKVALVTGASSGIGEATARKLAKEGLRVVMVARRAERLQALADQIRGDRQSALPLVADLTVEQERFALFQSAYDTYGTVDVLVNNAGFGWYGPGTQMPWSVAQTMVQTNITAVVHLTLLFLKDMKRRNSGHIINVGSFIGDMGTQGSALYGATKAFVGQFTTTLYRELRGTQVHVSVIKPGPVATEFFDVASRQAGAQHLPGERLSVTPERVACRIWDLLQRPKRVAYVPRVLSFTPWVEFYLGWLLDRVGPVLLGRQ